MFGDLLTVTDPKGGDARWEPQRRDFAHRSRIDLGSKARFASAINQRLGVADVYAEPFAGSLAVLLNRRPAKREVVCDRNGFICNFWRAIRWDPDAVAEAADWPTVHQDLTARHRWLVDWGAEHAKRLVADPRFYDPEAAGWWAWGASNWIGQDWCQARGDTSVGFVNKPWNGRGVHSIPDKRPATNDHPQSRGCAPSTSYRGVWATSHPEERGVRPNEGYPDKVPHAGSEPYDRRGIRPDGDGRGRDQIPFVSDKPRDNMRVGNGVRDTVPFNASVAGRNPGTRAAGDRLRPWFQDLADRLRNVIVLNRDWTSALTPTLLCDTPSQPGYSQAILLDPPYRTHRRSKSLYVSDHDGTSDAVAEAAYEWALKHGDRYRLAYCCHTGDFPVPDGWDAITSAVEERKLAEQIIFSPPCVAMRKQAGLFEEAS